MDTLFTKIIAENVLKVKKEVAVQTWEVFGTSNTITTEGHVHDTPKPKRNNIKCCQGKVPTRIYGGRQQNSI